MDLYDIMINDCKNGLVCTVASYCMHGQKTLAKIETGEETGYWHRQWLGSLLLDNEVSPR